MRVLVTGACGNVGAHTVDALLAADHQVRGFDLDTPHNRRLARRWRDRVEWGWGDLRRSDAVAAAVSDQEAVVHLAFVIPHLAAAGVNSEADPAGARAVNVGGTRHVIAAAQAQAEAPRLLFTSSLHVFGRTQHLPPPRRLTDPVAPIEHYAQHKVLCEELVRASGLNWCIFRLAAALPARLILDPGMFEVPLDNRIEFVHGRDVARAIVNALTTPAAWGQTWLIGGGPACQLYQSDIVRQVLKAVGVGMLPERAFTATPYPVDWLDTAESQATLVYQRHTLDDYVHDVRRQLGWRRHLVRAIQPALRAWLLQQSPYSRVAGQSLRVPSGEPAR